MNNVQIDILIRAAAGDRTAEEAASALILRGIRTYLRANGELDLARCCGLPTRTMRQAFSKMKRNYWLAAAASHIEGTGWARTVELANQIKTFLSRVWPAWRDLEIPPDAASALRTCLFLAVQACPMNFPTSAKHLNRIVGSDETASIHRDIWYLHTSTRAILEREAAMEFATSQALQDEFGIVNRYLAYRHAEAEGRIRYQLDVNIAADVPPRSI